MFRAIGIIEIDIMKRESMLLQEEYCLRHKELKLEIESLKEALNEIELSYSLNNVSKEFGEEYSSDDLVKYCNLQ